MLRYLVNYIYKISYFLVTYCLSIYITVCLFTCFFFVSINIHTQITKKDSNSRLYKLNKMKHIMLQMSCNVTSNNVKIKFDFRYNNIEISLRIMCSLLSFPVYFIILYLPIYYFKYLSQLIELMWKFWKSFDC